jgi:predicted transcriptional regulator
MTLTVKLESDLEEQLRQRAQASGRSTSDVVRAALQAYLAQEDEGPARSAFELGAEFFGRHSGPADLATRRKGAYADIVAERQRQRA